MILQRIKMEIVPSCIATMAISQGPPVMHLNKGSFRVFPRYHLSDPPPTLAYSDRSDRKSV